MSANDPSLWDYDVFAERLQSAIKQGFSPLDILRLLYELHFGPVSSDSDRDGQVPAISMALGQILSVEPVDALKLSKWRGFYLNRREDEHFPDDQAIEILEPYLERFRERDSE